MGAEAKNNNTIGSLKDRVQTRRSDPKTGTRSIEMKRIGEDLS